MEDVFTEVSVPIVTIWDDNVGGSENVSNKELGNLHGGKVAFPFRMIAQTG